MTIELSLILFTAPKCAPCIPAKGALQMLIDAGLVIGSIVDVTEQPALAAQYDVQAVPTLAVKHGRELTGVYAGTKVSEYLTTLERELTDWAAGR